MQKFKLYQEKIQLSPEHADKIITQRPIFYTTILHLTIFNYQLRNL